MLILFQCIRRRPKQQNDLQAGKRTSKLFQITTLSTFSILSSCGFRKEYSAQYCLLGLTEKFKEAVDNGNECEALLKDLSKVF